jgi:hypothetical protein
MTDFNSSDYKKKQTYMEDILYDLLNSLPSSYNKQLQDLNYFKLLRALAKELSDAQFNIDLVKDNISINA